MKTTTKKKSVVEIVEIEKEQKLKEINLKQLQNIFHNAPAAIAIFEGLEYKYILANKGYEKLTNRKAADLLGKSFKDIFPELKGTGAFELFDNVFKNGIPFTAPEYPAKVDLKNDGVLSQGYFNLSMEPLKNDAGEIYAIVAMTYDITEQIVARKKVEESEQRFRSLVEQAPVAMCVVRGDTFVFELANEKHLQLIGKTKEQIMNLPVFAAMPEVVGQGYEELLEGVYTNGIPFTANESPLTVIRNGKKEIKYVNYIFEPLYNAEHKIDGVFSVATDVTEQVLLRKRVEESEFRYQEMIYSSPSMISILKGEDMIIEIANDAIISSWGKGKDIIGKSIFLVLPEVVEQGFDKLLLKVYKTGESFHAVETPATMLRNGTNEISYYNFIYQAQRNIDGEIEGVAILAHEVTPQASLNKKIKESEQRYHTLFMHSPFAFSIMKGKDMKVTLANDLMLEFWGKGKNVEGKTLLEILPELSNQPFPAMIDSVYTTGVPVYANEILAQLNRNGIMEDKYFNIVYEPHFEADHTISGVITIAHEVTQQVVNRKKIQESEALFRLALFLTAKTVFKQNTQLEYTWIYNTHPTIEMENILGKTDSDLFSNDSAELLTTIKQTVLNTGNTFTGDIQIEIGGKLMDFAMSVEATKNSDGKIDGIIAVSDDITERKQYENNLMEAKTTAENATKAKQQFLSNMSHEIRTPLNSILGFTNVLLKTELGVAQKEFVHAIKTSGKSLNLLINDILDLAKVDAGKMTFEKHPIEIRKSITAILHSFDMKRKEKNLELAVEHDSKVPSVLLGDSLRLNQIFFNLLSNAVKFTHKGKIKLSIKLLHEDKENVTIEFVVSDSGIGIPDNKLNSIFNLFEQAEINTFTSYGGTGLGLSIVKQLVEGQGGSVSVKSKLGEGSAFSFTLPFGKTNLKLEEEIVLIKPNSEIKTLRVLVAEDVALNQLLIKIILNDFGFGFEIVGNGKLAIEKMQTNTYDIILMDLHMPEMNGFEATEYIRKTLKSHIPIIALTADVTTVDVSKCKEFGMDDYISKPINEDLLYRKIMEFGKSKH